MMPGSQSLSPTYEQAHVGLAPFDPGIIIIKQPGNKIKKFYR